MWKWIDLKRFVKAKSPRLDTADLGAVMWPVVYPVDMNPPKDPHITVVVFKGINDPDLGFTREDVIDAVRATHHDLMLWTRTEGIEWFGIEQDIPVLRVDHNYLHAYRGSLIRELSRRGIEYDKTFPVYKPHVSVTEVAALDGVFPERLLAGPVEVWWGNQQYKMGDPEGPGGVIL